MNSKNASPAPRKNSFSKLIIGILLLAGLAMIYSFNRPANDPPGNETKATGSISTNKPKITAQSNDPSAAKTQDYQEPTQTGQEINNQPIATEEGIDLIIENGNISSQASFYPYKSGRIRMEVLAARASDGTIRTAFNTCQVCYDSGRGYYVQEGDQLVCQNCGNRFDVDDVELIRGGCNPVPILPENKTDDGTRTTITSTFLDQNKDLFTNWKKG